MITSIQFRNFYLPACSLKDEPKDEHIGLKTMDLISHAILCGYKTLSFPQGSAFSIFFSSAPPPAPFE